MTDTPRIKVWDAPTRAFHWLLVLMIGLSWYTQKIGGLAKPIGAALNDMGHMVFLSDAQIHGWIGQATLALILFRLLWGLVGSTTARFSHFVRGPAAVAGYLKTTRSGGGGAPTVGHNPAGGWMVVVMLCVIAAQGAMGLFANDDIMFDGPLMGIVGKESSDGLTALHKLWFKILLGLVGLHVAAVLFYKFVKRDDLIRPMITGWRDWPAGHPAPSLAFRHPVLAAVLLGLAGWAVWLLATKGLYGWIYLTRWLENG